MNYSVVMRQHAYNLFSNDSEGEGELFVVMQLLRVFQNKK